MNITSPVGTQDRGIVVFGGAGFIGSHLLRRMAASGRHPLFSVDMKDPKIAVAGVNYIKMDLRKPDYDRLPSNISRIYNFAAVHTTPGHENHEYYETNILGAETAITYARRTGVREIIFTSSISIYGPSEERKTEKSDPSPVSAYGWSKWLAERIHAGWLEENAGNRLIICRPAVVFGRAEKGNFTRLARLLKTGFFIYPGRTDTIKACIYVDDLLDALEYSSSCPDRFIVFNGSYSDRLSIEQIVGAFRQKYFPAVRELRIPKGIMMAGASLLQPVSALHLGIHPDRILKLLRSTDVYPDWLEGRGFHMSGLFPSALDRWYKDSNGAFE